MPTEPTSPNILALHGFTGVGADFVPFADLCGGTWHCPNLPGHGPEPQLDCRPEATLRFIESQVSGLRSQASGLRPQVSSLSSQPSTPNVLLGYSMGARAALLHACTYPDRWDALILISPNPGIEDETSHAERRRVDEKLAQRIEYEGADAFIEFWQNTPMIRSQQNIRKDWRDSMLASRKQHTAPGLATSLRQFGQGQCPNLWPELNKLTMPVMLMTGSEDLKYTRIAEKMSRALPNGTHRKIEGAGHMPQLERPKASASSIQDFLDTLS